MEAVKVISCEHLKDHEKDGKKTPIYKVGLSDGTFGESYAKEIPVGTPVDQIEITEGQYGKKLKLKSQGKGGFGGGRPPDKKNAGFALSYAKDLVVSILPLRDELKTSKTVELATVIKGIADIFYKWLEEKNPGH